MKVRPVFDHLRERVAAVHARVRGAGDRRRRRDAGAAGGVAGHVAAHPHLSLLGVVQVVSRRSVAADADPAVGAARPARPDRVRRALRGVASLRRRRRLPRRRSRRGSSVRCCASTRRRRGRWRRRSREASRTRLTWTPSHLFLLAHGGLDRGAGGRDAGPDAAARRRRRTCAKRSNAAGCPCVRRPDRPPRVLVTSGVNPLRRWPLPQVVERVLWPKLKLIVAIDTRLSTTGMKADLMLPAAGLLREARHQVRGRAGALRRLRRPGDAAARRVEAGVGNHGAAGAAHPGAGARARHRGLACNDLRSLHRRRQIRTGRRHGRARSHHRGVVNRRRGTTGTPPAAPGRCRCAPSRRGGRPTASAARWNRRAA